MATTASYPGDLDLLRGLGPSFLLGPVHLGSALDQTGQLSFYNSSSALPTIFQAGNATTSLTYTLPTAGPLSNGQALTGTTVGVMSWATFPALNSAFVTIGNDSTLTGERALTGTTNQVVVTDNGANSTVVLSLPQSIHSGATPTFTGLNFLTAPAIVSANSVTAFKVVSAGTSDATLYQPIVLFGGGGASSVPVEMELYTNTGVTTSAKQIAQLDAGGAIYFVFGDDGAGNQFLDIVTTGATTTAPNVVSTSGAGTIKGTPAARTYTKPATTNVSVTMGSGTYTVRSFGFDLAPR